MTEQEITYEQVRALLDQSERDALTGLYTFEAFRILSRTIIASQKGHRDINILYYNFEEFRNFNEEDGFEEGNGLLRKFAELTRTAFPERATARLWGDRFASLVYGSEVDAGLQIIRDHMSDIEKRGSSNLKIGICRIEETDVDVAISVDHAKSAAESIRRIPGQLFRWYDADLEKNIQRSKYIVGHIDEAIEKRWLKAFYQPVLRTLTGEVCSQEALARWDDPEYGLLSPNVFINTLEEYHLIHKLDIFMIRTICEDLADARAHGEQMIPTSFNVSRLDFAFADLHQTMNDILKEYAIPREMIHVEITESALYGSEEAMIDHIRRFHEDGYEVWMDDFGSGYSSLNTLQSFDFDLIKIDMMFLRNVNDKTPHILAAIVDMAKDLKIHTLAEGVETEKQLDFLREIGCERAQGYYLSRPLPLQEVRSFYRDRVRLEHSGMHVFYDAVGRLNFLSGQPLKDVSQQNGLPSARSGVPLGIAICEDRQIRLTYANQECLALLDSLGVGTLDQVEAYVNGPGMIRDRLMSGFAQASNDEETVTLDFVLDNKYYQIGIQRIAENRGAVAFAISFRDLSANEDLAKKGAVDKTLPYVYSAFEVVNVINVPENTILHVYSNSSFLHKYTTENLKEGILSFTEEEIYLGDQSKYRDFFNIDTLDERVSGAFGSIDGYFRTNQKDGGYIWKQFIIQALDLNRGEYLVLIRLVSGQEMLNLVQTSFVSEQISDSAEYTDLITRTLLWDTAISSVKAGVFWKDTQRRFVGANQMFLDYYGLRSVEEIQGKTDEDMGWHVDPEPYREDELRVLHQGIQTSNVVGKCLVGGENRDIVASKIPIYRGGTIVGLMGYFRDVTDELKSQQQMENMVYTDVTTSTLNRYGFRGNMTAYVSSYQKNNADFALIVLNILNFKQFNDVYGHAFGDAVIAEVADALRAVVSRNCILGHVSGDEFAVAMQFLSRAQVTEMAGALTQAVEKIHQVNGIPCTVYTYIGISYFSESGTTDEMVRLAQARMLAQKRSRMPGKEHRESETSYDSEEIIPVMKELRKVFDIVRLVQPGETTAVSIDEEGLHFDEPYCCYGLLNKDRPCTNCISRETIQTRKTHTKFEEDGHYRYVVVSRFLEVDGQEMALELVQRVGN